MTSTPEQLARQEIDRLLGAAGWHLCGVSDVNIHAAQGVAVREFPLKGGDGFADYLLYVDGKAAGVIEAKKAGIPLIGVEPQAGRYAAGLPENLPGPAHFPSRTNPRAWRHASPTGSTRSRDRDRSSPSTGRTRSPHY